MKTYFRLTLALVCLPAALLSQSVSPPPLVIDPATFANSNVLRLDRLVKLTAPQQQAVREVFEKEAHAIQGLRPDERPIKAPDAHRVTVEHVRALLTAEQLALYDHTSITEGGSVEFPTAELRLKFLERTMTLTPAQRAVALQVYQEEFDSVAALPPTDRLIKAGPYRQAAEEQIRALLSPEQLAKDDQEKTRAAAQRAEDKNLAEADVRQSKAVEARVGKVTVVKPMGSTTVNTMRQGRKGTSTFKVTGDTGYEILTVVWEQPDLSGARVSHIEDGRGQPIGP